MPDKPGSPADLHSIANRRMSYHATRHAAMTEVEQAIKGNLNSEYEKLFSPGEVKIQLKTIRTADDGLTKLVSKVFPILVNPLGKRESDTARAKAEKVEQIAYGWNDGSAQRGGPEMDGIMFQLARHQVRYADGVLRANPDYDRKLIWFDVVDPRLHFPPEGWNPWSPVPLDGTMLISEMSLGEVKRRFGYDSYGDSKPDVLARLHNAFASKSGYGSGGQTDNDAQMVKIATYYSREAWMIACFGHDCTVPLIESQTGDKGHPGVCPITSFMQFESEPLFSGQVGLEAVLSKVFNQQIENTDRINRAPIVGPPLMGDEFRWGEYNVVDLSLMGQNRSFLPQRMAPDSPNNLMNVTSQLLSLAQMFNYNPPSFQGEGEANSGKALQALQAGPRALVTDILWAPFKTGFPRAYDNCLEMELKLWPNERKSASGRNGKQNYEVDYTPSVDLRGYKGRIKIEEGYGLGGYSQTIEAMQMHQAKLMPRRQLLEQYPGVRDAAATERALDAEKVVEWMEGLLAAKGPNLAIQGLVRIREELDNGSTLFEAIRKADEEGVLEPPPPPEVPEGMPPELAGGLPPELAAMLGGSAGALPPGGPPNLVQERGF